MTAVTKSVGRSVLFNKFRYAYIFLHPPVAFKKSPLGCRPVCGRSAIGLRPSLSYADLLSSYLCCPVAAGFCYSRFPRISDRWYPRIGNYPINRGLDKFCGFQGIHLVASTLYGGTADTRPLYRGPFLLQGGAARLLQEPDSELLSDESRCPGADRTHTSMDCCRRTLYRAGYLQISASIDCR